METPLRVLIIEDDLLMATSIEEHLIGAGYVVCEKAVSYETAVKAMKQSSPDILLVDVQLEGAIDGIATVGELLRIKWVPVIYITGNSETNTFSRAKRTFPAAFLRKPIRVRELSEQIDLAMYNFYAGNIPGVAEQIDHTFLPTGNGYVRIIKSEIMFVKADRNQSELFLTKEGFDRLYSGKPYQAVSIRVNLGKLISYLTGNFYKLSRSLIINLDYLDRIEANQLFVGSHEIAMPEGARKPLIEHLRVVRTRP